MGLSVYNQIDTSKYFSLTTIDKKVLDEKGITMSITRFREIVRRSPPHMSIYTGSDRIMGRCRRTNIYRYDDFLYLVKSKNDLKGGEIM